MVIQKRLEIASGRLLTWRRLRSMNRLPWVLGLRFAQGETSNDQGNNYFLNWGAALSPRLGTALCPTIGQAACPKCGDAPAPKVWGGARAQQLRKGRAQNLGEACPTFGNHVSRIWAGCKIIENANPITKKQLCPKVEQALPKRWNDDSGGRPKFWARGSPKFWARGPPQILGTVGFPTFGRGGLRKFWELPPHKVLEMSACPHLGTCMPKF